MPSDEKRETPTRAQIDSLILAYASAYAGCAVGRSGATEAFHAAQDKLAVALDAALTAEHEARARDAEDAERYRFLRHHPLDAEYINDHALGREAYDRLTDEARTRAATRGETP